MTTVLALALAAAAGLSTPARAAPRATPEELFLEANRAYDEGRHADAVALYEQLVDAGAASGHVYYNLGNAYLRAGALGQAIAAYREAQRELPRDGDLSANLAFARQATKDAIEAPAPPVLVRTVFFWHFFLGRTEQLTALGALNLIFWAALALRRRRPGSEWLTWVVWGTGVPLVALAGSQVVHLVRPEPVAVVTADQIDVRAATTPDAVVLFTLHEGTEARIVDHHGDWVRVRLADGNGGWVPQTAVAEVPRPERAPAGVVAEAP